MHSREIIALAELVLEGHPVTRGEALRLAETGVEDIPLLGAYANKIRAKFAGQEVDMCGVVNARSGLCPEDCGFCAQSVHHRTNCRPFPLISPDEAEKALKELDRAGARRASIVTSGKGMVHDPDFAGIIALLRRGIETAEIGVCANLGTIGLEQAAALAAAGLKRYAHNLETSRRFYPSVCTTHSYEERWNTLQAAKSAGLELCSGGIIGLGETWEDRIDLALALRALAVSSVPVNILNPVKGTALEGQPPLHPLEIIKTFAIFRFILPDKVIRPAGGREINLRDMQGALLLAGANGLIVGNYLTFGGRDSRADFTMVHDAGLVPGSLAGRKQNEL